MIKIEKLDHNGRGISKINGKIAFIENSLPGEIVNVQITKDKKNYIEANVIEYIKKSKKRTNEQCPYFNICGGCDLQHIKYEDQLKFKENKIKNIVNKYLNENIKINKIIRSINQYSYRNKVTFHVKNNKLGFFKKNSNEIIEVDKCLLADNLINKSIDYLKKLNLNYVDKIVCRTSLNKLMLIITTNKKDINIDCLKNVADSIYIKQNNVHKLIHGEKNIINYVDNFKYIVSPNSFFQINIDVCAKLYKKIKSYCDKDSDILDLYCGTGSIGIFVSENNNVLGIEINENAIKDANKNKLLNNIKNIEFICGPSEKYIDKINFMPNIIIVDPPRAGLDKKTISHIKKINPKKIIYVSCDPMTLVRDLNELKDKYKIIELTPYDMFPNTSHIETLVKLEKM